MKTRTISVLLSFCGTQWSWKKWNSMKSFERLIWSFGLNRFNKNRFNKNRFVCLPSLKKSDTKSVFSINNDVSKFQRFWGKKWQIEVNKLVVVTNTSTKYVPENFENFFFRFERDRKTLKSNSLLQKTKKSFADTLNYQCCRQLQIKLSSDVRKMFKNFYVLFYKIITQRGKKKKVYLLKWNGKIEDYVLHIE